MNPRQEVATYVVLIVLLIGAAALFLWNVSIVTAGTRYEYGTIEIAEFGTRSETDFSLEGGAVPDVLKVFTVRDPFAPIATPPPTPTKAPTLTPTPTIPPCAVGWTAGSMTQRMVKLQPKGGKPKYVREGEMLDNVMVKEIRYSEKKVVVQCTDTGVEVTLVQESNRQQQR